MFILSTVIAASGLGATLGSAIATPTGTSVVTGTAIGTGAGAGAGLVISAAEEAEHSEHAFA